MTRSIMVSLSRFAWILLLLFVVLLTGCNKRIAIVNGVDEREANEIIVYLASRSIHVSKVQNKSSSGSGVGGGEVTWNLTVDKAQETEAMALLNIAGLPRRRGVNLLDIFSKQGLVSSEQEEQIRYTASLESQLGGIVRKIDGVVDADVQISFPQKDPLNPNPENEKVTAAVFVKHQGVLDNPNNQLVTKIKLLVSGSVDGLNFDDVTVVADRARFTDITVFPQANDPSSLNSRDWESIWSIVVDKESAFRFRVIFFILSLVILILALIIAWIGWKFHLIISQLGMKKFFGLRPIIPPDQESSKQKSETQESEEPVEEEESSNPPK